MKTRYLTLAIPGLLAAVSLAAVAQESVPVTLESPELAVTLDPAFPRLIQYRHKADGATFDGQVAAVAAVELNGKAEPCKISFKRHGKSGAEYLLNFPEAKIEITLQVTVLADGVELKTTKIQENGPVKLKTFAFPGNALLTLNSAQPDAAIATAYGAGYGNLREKIGALSTIKPVAETANYAFVSAGKLAAGIVSNHIDDHQRISYQVADKDGGKRITLATPLWQCREIDTETVPLPWVKVIVTGDRNGDGLANWQDAALVCRASLPKPYGAEFVHSMVADQIAMDFGSLAQQPFLRILDEVKTGYLLTDGIGQSVLIKGFTAEGHDSANTDCGGHYNERAGGLKDLNFLMEHAHDYNARIGVHINVTEAYPEAHRYNPEILTPNGGWAWLDSSRLIDKRKDLLSGQLFASLDLMRKELKFLDFIYVDVYGDHGWNSWKLAGKLNEMKLPVYSEYGTVFDPASTWSHARMGSQIFRFLWNSDRDLFGGDSLLRGGRAEDDGFMGWQGARSLSKFARSTFARNLPTKYLQNFELLRWVPDQEAVFSDGIKVTKTGDLVTVTQNGRTVMTWNGYGSNNRLFVPWDPKSETKIYAWDDIGTEQAWELPPSWKKAKTVYLYKLTDLGRTEETNLPVAEGKITLKLEKNTPYVVYAKPAPAQGNMNWGEGGLVKDPGFDSGKFSNDPRSWFLFAINKDGKPNPSRHIRVEKNELGQYVLKISGDDGTGHIGTGGNVTQQLKGLEPGQVYAASAWVRIKGKRTASIFFPKNAIDRTDVVNLFDSDAKKGTKFQRLRTIFTAPKDGNGTMLLSLNASEGPADSSVEFDDVRVVKITPSPEAKKHYYFEDFEAVDQGWGPFVYACNGQTQTHLSERHEGFTDDVIGGRYSFKTLNEPAGMVVRTLPSFLRLKPYTKYRMQIDTLADTADLHHLVIQGKANSTKSIYLDKAVGKGQGKLDETFTTGASTESFLAVIKIKAGGGKLVLDNIIIDELGTVPVPPGGAAIEEDDNALAGSQTLLDETFARPLDAAWTPFVSKRPGTAVAVANGALAITANAHVSAGTERKLPAGTTAVECTIGNDSDKGETWGIGLGLVWPDGKALRVNIRNPDGGFGIDWTPAKQSRTGRAGKADITLRLRLEADKAFAEARNEDDDWQTLATFPRAEFPGDPERVRIGKMHGVEGTDDNPDPGAPGASTIKRLRIYGK